MRNTKEPSYVKQFGPNLAISSANEEFFQINLK